MVWGQVPDYILSDTGGKRKKLILKLRNTCSFFSVFSETHTWSWRTQSTELPCLENSRVRPSTAGSVKAVTVINAKHSWPGKVGLIRNRKIWFHLGSWILIEQLFTCKATVSLALKCILIHFFSIYIGVGKSRLIAFHIESMYNTRIDNNTRINSVFMYSQL